MIPPLLLCGAGLLWLFGLWRQPALPLWTLIVAGLALRALALAIPPYEEIDFYRYFWDGVQLLNGFSPYAHPISSILKPLPQALETLQNLHPELVGNIRHDTWLFSTIYAPGALAVFALLTALPGPSTLAFAGSFLLAELFAVRLLHRLASAHGNERGRAQGRNLVSNPSLQRGLWAVALNPLVILTTYNGLHFDIWLLPLLLGWVLALRKQQFWSALLFLLLALVLRHWPVLLIPLTLMALPTWRLRALVGLGLSLLLPVLFWPQLAHFWTAHSGLRVYGGQWEMNDALFLLLETALGQNGGRVLALLVPGALACLLPLTPWRLEPASAALLIVGSLLLLSPTFLPWYWLWLLPFLICSALRLTWAGWTLGALLPLAYLRFWLAERGQESLFDQGLVWVEFAPVLLLSLWLFPRNSNHNRNSNPAPRSHEP